MYLTKFNNKLKKGTANIIDSLIVFKTKDIKKMLHEISILNYKH